MVAVEAPVFSAISRFTRRPSAASFAHFSLFGRAPSIYGTNGANGVILITTKHGKDGKPSVSYNGYLGIEDFAHKMDFCNGAQITQRYKDYVAQNAGETMYNDYVKNANEAAAQAAGQETDWIYDMVSQTGAHIAPWPFPRRSAPCGCPPGCGPRNTDSHWGAPGGSRRR